jgi:hypothetical protein
MSKAVIETVKLNSTHYHIKNIAQAHLELTKFEEFHQCESLDQMAFTSTWALPEVLGCL